MLDKIMTICQRRHCSSLINVGPASLSIGFMGLTAMHAGDRDNLKQLVSELRALGIVFEEGATFVWDADGQGEVTGVGALTHGTRALDVEVWIRATNRKTLEPDDSPLEV